MRASNSRLFNILLCVVLLTATFLSALDSQNTYAADLTSRSLTLIDGTTDAGGKVSGVVRHRFKFTVPATVSVGSIKFQYCTTAGVGTCDMPTGLITTAGATLLENQVNASGFTLDKTTNGVPYLTRAAASIDAGTLVSYDLTNITNPSTTDNTKMTFFVRISTYTSIDTTGTAIDTGTVAASTSTQIILTGTMPESLIFCAGATVTAPGGIPDCSTITTGAVAFNQLFSPTDTASATSQMAASTNAASGYSISVNGTTLKSGSNSVTALAARTANTRGVSQFGLNLKKNTALTSIALPGTEVTAAYDADINQHLRGQAASDYSLADSYKFTATTPGVSGEEVAASDTATNSQIFTATYIVNVPGSQAAGEYTTTLTYVCTAKF